MEEPININVFCAFPMHGLSTEVVDKRRHELFERGIQCERERMKAAREQRLSTESMHCCLRPYDFINENTYKYTLLDQIHKENIPEDAGRLWYLGDSIQILDKAELVIFGKDWKDAKGCNVEMEACKQYDIPILVEGIDFE